MKLKIENDVVEAEITTEHSASSYGMPVLVVDGKAVGFGEIGGWQLIEATNEEREMLKRGRYEFDGWPPERIKALRGNLSQEAFARELGVTLNTVYSWESGRRQPSGLAKQALERFERARQ